MNDPLQFVWSLVQINPAVLAVLAALFVGYVLKLIPSFPNQRNRPSKHEQHAATGSKLDGHGRLGARRCFDGCEVASGNQLAAYSYGIGLSNHK